MYIRDVEEIQRAVRAHCAARTWSRGVELSRSGAVTNQRDGEDGELSCRVKDPGRMVAPTVLLYPEDAEWDCSCLGKIDPCEHVVGAILAIRKALETGTRLPETASDEPKLIYQFKRRQHAALLLFRAIRKPGVPDAELAGSIHSHIRESGDEVPLRDEDLRIDRLLLTRGRGLLPPEMLSAIL